jgi:rare lipoprotein A
MSSRVSLSSAVAFGVVILSSVAVPGSDGEPVLQRGVASWYGAFHHGRQTANGEIFDSTGLSAAHRTLPFGTRVRVRNERTGRSIVVRINDRGPYVPGRVIDLSHAAAQWIGLQGIGPVVITRVETAQLGSDRLSAPPL